MEALAASAPTVALHLKTFELSCEAQDADPSEERAIANFLTSFRGLENLYLHVEAMLHEGSDSILRAASHHRDTLRRFSYQIRRWRRFLPDPYAEPLETLGLDAEDLGKMAVDNILTSLRSVEPLGLAGRPRILGIKSVELLAFGDFSCRGRYLDKSFVARRRQTGANDDKEGNYSACVLYDQERHGHQKILRLETLLDRSYAFLRSAPTESLPLSY
ncbi:hypothetical protein DL767_004412 [Monosporascus sp. MG133]|nr:hypothetical protein DL767_004412 [Monosporascus sp. MG133]